MLKYFNGLKESKGNLNHTIKNTHSTHTTTQ